MCSHVVGDTSRHVGGGSSSSASGGGGGVGSAASSMTVEGSGRGARIGLQVSGTGVGRGSPASGVVSRGSPRGPGAWGVSSVKVCLVWWTVHLVFVLALGVVSRVFTCHVISLERVIVLSCHVYEESFRGIRRVECGVNLCEFVLMLSTTWR